MWSRVNRLRRLDNGGLHHTEWSRRLGSVAISAFLASVGFPLGVFLLVPYCAKEIAGPSTSLSVLMAFVVTILTGLHLVEMCGRLPKSGCTYTFVYVTFGELWAFLCAWTTVFDYCAMAAYLAKGWSTHFDFMFHGNVKKYMSPILFDHFQITIDALSSMANNNATVSDYSTNEAVLKSAGIFDERLDMLAAVGLLTAALVAFLGVSVISTICMAFLIVGTLVVSSSILVGFFYANVSIWTQHGFFIAGFEGVCTAASYILRAMIGLEMVGSLIEETTNPQNRFAILLPLMNSLLFIYLFIMSVIITLVIPYTDIPSDAALPSIYGQISVPASRYVLSVGSICAFSGALLASIVPPIRYLHALSADGLLCGCCSKFSSIVGGVPLAAFVASFILTSILLFFQSTVLLSILRILLPARFLLLTGATLLQRYRDTPTGLLAEVANYKAVQFKSKSISSFFSGAGTSGVSTTDGAGSNGMYNGRRSSINSRNASDRYSISSSFIMRNIAAAQYELNTNDDFDDDDDDDEDGNDVLFEHRGDRSINKKRSKRRSKKNVAAENHNDHKNGETSKFDHHLESLGDDDEVTIFNRNLQSTPLPRSVTGELSTLLMKQSQSGQIHPSITSDSIAPTSQTKGKNMKKSATSHSFQSISLTDATTTNDQNQKKNRLDKNQTSDSHNCVRSPCDPTSNSDPFYHLYQRDIPDGMPYCETFSMYAPSSTAINQCLIYRKAKLWLGFCICAHLACAICIVRGWQQLENGTWWMYLISAFSFSAAVIGTVALAWLPQNIDNRVRHQVPAVPYLALLNSFLLSLMLASADFGGLWKVGVVLVSGLVVYAIYGYKHSVENLRSLHIAPQALTSETDENTGLVAPLTTYQMSETTSKSSFGGSIRGNGHPTLSDGVVHKNGNC